MRNKTKQAVYTLVSFCILVFTTLLLYTGCISIQPKTESTPERSYLLYFADQAALAEEERCPYEGFVTGVERTGNSKIELYKDMITALIAGPSESEKNVAPVISSQTRLLGLELDDAVAYINLSSEAYVPLHAPGIAETVLTDAIILTMTQFPQVIKVQLSVESSPWVTGDFTWDRPIGQFEILPAS